MTGPFDDVDFEALYDETLAEGFGSVIVGNRHDGASGIYVGLGTVFGNPFKRESERHGRQWAIDSYYVFLDEHMRDPASPLRRAVENLARRVSMGERLTLVCSCAPAPCHADALRQAILLLAWHMHTNRT